MALPEPEILDPICLNPKILIIAFCCEEPRKGQHKSET